MEISSGESMLYLEGVNIRGTGVTAGVTAETAALSLARTVRDDRVEQSIPQTPRRRSGQAREGGGAWLPPRRRSVRRDGRPGQAQTSAGPVPPGHTGLHS